MRSLLTVVQKLPWGHSLFAVKSRNVYYSPQTAVYNVYNVPPINQKYRSSCPTSHKFQTFPRLTNNYLLVVECSENVQLFSFTGLIWVDVTNFLQHMKATRALIWFHRDTLPIVWWAVAHIRYWRGRRPRVVLRFGLSRLFLASPRNTQVLSEHKSHCNTERAYELVRICADSKCCYFFCSAHWTLFFSTPSLYLLCMHCK